MAHSDPARRRILVTTALPYANAPLHLGHMVEHIQSDIWARFQRLRGHECIHVCAIDAHGTPIMLKARELGIEPEALVRDVGTSHMQDLGDFLIQHDNFYTTHSDENRELAESMYLALKDAGHIERRTIRQAYDEQAGMFLPDRFVRGTCPVCKTEDQYGDSCENCGATYSPSELIEPVSAISGTKPIARESEHLFFKLADFTESLRNWTGNGRLHKAITSKLEEWFEAGFRDWDITRDAPYFGFAVPGEKDKYFYVWLDAPIGYMASFKNLCARRPDLSFDDFWRNGNDTELYHFIGKDILYFHTLFWPAVLEGSGYRQPTSVFVHGFLTVDGTKMSKSRGTFIMARKYLELLGPEYLRYYFASKLGSGVDDIDFNLDDFVARVNSDIVGKLVNIASRCAGFIHRLGDGKLATELDAPRLTAEFTNAADDIANSFENREYAHAIRQIMGLADKANQYIDQRRPWELTKDESRHDEIQAIATQGLEFFRILVIYLKPVLPELARRAEEFLDVDELSWDDLPRAHLAASINRYEPLMTRIALKDVRKLTEAATDKPPADAKKDTSMIDIADFQKLDLRVARIVSAEPVDGADKLLRLTLDLGDSSREVLAGVRESYDASKLPGRLTVVVANLKPKKLRFGVSEGMVLAAGPGGKDIFLVSPDEGAEPGMRVK